MDSLGPAVLQAGWNSQNGAINAAFIPLNTVIDDIVQKTYHDIIVMADLLPGKPDMERKIDIAHFANRTRQLVIRLLAVVKWAGSVGKVMKCTEITDSLEEQTRLFVDTADKLHTLANQVVVQARLPNFSVPAAVDVLSTGTYPRLPKAIRDKIIPPDPITPMEKLVTLERLNRIIMYRLVATKIPLQIVDLAVDNGMVKLVVPGEFEAILTLMGDAEDVPWRLLKLEFVVKDAGTGGGRALVHHLQMNYIHELVQSRLIANEEPLQDLYNVLHSFCLSLKIEVLQSQMVRLIQKRCGRLVQIDEYQPGINVVMSYWRLNPIKSVKQETMTVTVNQRQQQNGWILDVTHKPPLILQNIQLVERASQISDLSFERLLCDTIRIRSFHKLYELKRMLQKHIKNDVSRILDDKSCLLIPLIQPCQGREHIHISVDPQTGIYIPASTCVSHQTLNEMEKSINEAPVNLLLWISKFRNDLAKERCKSSVQNLPVLILESLPLINRSPHPISSLSKELMYLKLTNFNQYYVIVEFTENEHNSLAVVHRYFLLNTVSTDASQQCSGINVKSDTLVQMEAPVHHSKFEDGTTESHFNAELTQIISACDARIPYISLMHELAQEAITHQGMLEDGRNVGLSVKLVTFPDVSCNVLPHSLCETLQSSILDCSFRLVDKSSKMAEPAGAKVWNVEMVFSECPLKTVSQEGKVTNVTSKFDLSENESPVKLFKDEWTSILQLYRPVTHFVKALADDESDLHQMVSVYSYNYRLLVLKYGPEKRLLVTIRWSMQGSKFVLLFGRCDSAGSNGHNIASHYISNMFNSDPDIGKLVQVLHDTCEPLLAACLLPTIPLIGMTSNQPGVAQQNSKSVFESFMVIVQTPSHFRLIYRSTFMFEVYCMSNKIVGVRDGSLARFDSTKVKDGMLPIPGLKSFLSLFESRGNARRSVVEKDNPSDVQSVAGTSLGGMRTIMPGVWAGNNPIVIDQEMFTALVSKPGPPNQYSVSILEHFLGLTLIRRELELIVRSPSSPDYYFPSTNLFPNVPPDDPLTIVFAVNTLMFCCTMQFPRNRPHLTVRVQPVPQLLLQERGLLPENWQTDNLLILEQFFLMRVATKPFRPSNAHAFCNIISSKSAILRDFINVMRLELSNHQSDPLVKWTPQICLTVPPRLSYAPSGVPAVYIKDKILIFVLMTMKNVSNPQLNRQSIVMPIVWYPQTNVSTLPGKSNPFNPSLTRIEAHLRQWMERRPTNTDCLMSSAVKYLMDNFPVS